MASFMDLTGQRYGRLSVTGRAENDRFGGARWVCICDCGKVTTARASNLRQGGVQSCGCLSKDERLSRRKPDDEVTYDGAHGRLKVARGYASTHTCVDCGQRAREWSLRHDATDTRIGPTRRGSVCTYSLDINAYEPRCRACHNSYDNKA